MHAMIFIEFKCMKTMQVASEPTQPHDEDSELMELN